jgi:3-oxoadipate CoA-transferase, alpha subunit
MIDKQVETLAEAVAGTKDGATVLVGGFSAGDEPAALSEALLTTGARDLTIVNNGVGGQSRGIAALIREHRVARIICSYPRFVGGMAFADAYKSGEVALEVVPQGTLSERMRAAAAGIGGFYTKVSAGTLLGEGKETRIIDGESYVFEHPIKGDVALIGAYEADRWGNLVFRHSRRNFHPIMAQAAALSVAQVKAMVPLGHFHPDQVHCQGIFVDRVVVVDGNPLNWGARDQ